MAQQKKEAQEETASATASSANPHINRNRAISQLLRADRDERERTRLIAENRRLKAENAQLKAEGEQK